MEFKVVYYDNNQMYVDIVPSDKIVHYKKYTARVYPVDYEPGEKGSPLLMVN